MKKQSLRILSLGLVISMLMLCLGFLSFNNVAFAESVQPSFESFTDTDKYYYDNNEYKIEDYKAINIVPNANLTENYGESGKYACTIKYAQDPETNMMRLIANGDDPSITNNEIFNCFYKRIKLLILIQYQSTLK